MFSMAATVRPPGWCSVSPAGAGVVLARKSGCVPQRPVVAATAADILFGYASPEIWDLFCTDRGWSPHQLEQLGADTLIAALLPNASS